MFLENFPNSIKFMKHDHRTKNSIEVQDFLPIFLIEIFDKKRNMQ
jgi:hypothetical protein